jgi:hypothetical protein
LSVMVSEPVTAPPAGVNRIRMVQLAPEANVAPQLPLGGVTLAKPVPLTTMLEMLKFVAPPPVFVRITSLVGAGVVPTWTLPNANVVALRLATGTAPSPVSDTV